MQEVSHEHPALRGHYSGIHRNHYQNRYEIYNGPSDYRRYNINSDETGSCTCSCQECDYKPKLCCKRICKSCRKSQPHLAQFQQVPSSLVMVPYLMPFLVYPIKKTTHRTTRTQLETKSTRPIWQELKQETEFKKFEEENLTATTSTFILDPEYEKQEVKLSIGSNCEKQEQGNYVDSKKKRLKSVDGKIHQKLVMYQNMGPTVKTNGGGLKDTGKRLPKYGLIPIPDDLAEKLMLQLKDL